MTTRVTLLESLNNRIREYPYAAAALLVLVPSITFSGVLKNALVYDDRKQLIDNPFVRSPHLWRLIFTGPVWSFNGKASQVSFYRPLHIFSYWVICRFCGPEPFAYHLFQWLLYSATVWLVFRLGRELFRNEIAAFIGALLWSLHPLHVETVAWIAGFPDAGMGFFYLLALCLFLRAERDDRRRTLFHLLGALAYLISLFYKEMALSLPLVLLVYGFFFPGKKSWLVKISHWSPYGGATVIYVAIRILALGRFSNVAHPWNVSRRVAAAALGLLGQHTQLFFWPRNLSVFRTFAVGPSLRTPWPWLTLLVLLIACGLRRREPMLGFLALWWGITLLPCLDVRHLSFPQLADRFSYVPSVGLCLAVSLGCVRWFLRGTLHPKLVPAAFPLLVFVLLLWTVQDFRAIANWRDDDALTGYALRASPDSAIVHIRHGVDLQFRSDPEEAAREFETALKLNRASTMPLASVNYDAYIGLGQVAYLKGRRDEAMNYFYRAVRELPGQSWAYDVLGSVYFPNGEYVRAAEYYGKAVEVNSFDLFARFCLGTCWMKLGRYHEAVEQFRAAREVDPTYWQAWDGEVHALEAAGDRAGAARVRGLKPSP